MIALLFYFLYSTSRLYPLPYCTQRETRDSVAEDISVSSITSLYVLPSGKRRAALIRCAICSTSLLVHISENKSRQSCLSLSEYRSYKIVYHFFVYFVKRHNFSPKSFQAIYLKSFFFSDLGEPNTSSRRAVFLNYAFGHEEHLIGNVFANSISWLQLSLYCLLRLRSLIDLARKLRVERLWARQSKKVYPAQAPMRAQSQHAAADRPKARMGSYSFFAKPRAL